MGWSWRQPARMTRGLGTGRHVTPRLSRALLRFAALALSPQWALGDDAPVEARAARALVARAPGAFVAKNALRPRTGSRATQDRAASGGTIVSSRDALSELLGLCHPGARRRRRDDAPGGGDRDRHGDPGGGDTAEEDDDDARRQHFLLFRRVRERAHDAAVVLRARTHALRRRRGAPREEEEGGGVGWRPGGDDNEGGAEGAPRGGVVSEIATFGVYLAEPPSGGGDGAAPGAVVVSAAAGVGARVRPANAAHALTPALGYGALSCCAAVPDEYGGGDDDGGARRDEYYDGRGGGGERRLAGGEFEEDEGEFLFQDAVVASSR